MTFEQWWRKNRAKVLTALSEYEAMKDMPLVRGVTIDDVFRRHGISAPPEWKQQAIDRARAEASQNYEAVKKVAKEIGKEALITGVTSLAGWGLGRAAARIIPQAIRALRGVRAARAVEEVSSTAQEAAEIVRAGRAVQQAAGTAAEAARIARGARPTIQVARRVAQATRPVLSRETVRAAQQAASAAIRAAKAAPKPVKAAAVIAGAQAAGYMASQVAEKVASKQEPRPAEGLVEAAERAILRGAIAAGKPVAVLKSQLTGNAEELAEMNAAELYVQPSPEFEEFSQAKNLHEAWTAFKKDPLKVMTEITAQSLATMLPTVGGAQAAGAVLARGFSPAMARVTAATSTGLGSYAVEVSNSILDAFRDAGVDITDPDKLARAFRDPYLYMTARDYAIKRGVPIGLLDAVSVGLAGKLVHGGERVLASTWGKIAAGVIGGAGELGMQAATGAAGEALGQLWSQGRITSVSDVLAEALGEVLPGAIETVGGTLQARAQEEEGQAPPSPTEPQAPPSPTEPQAPPSPTEPQVPPWMSPGRSVQEILAVMQPVAPFPTEPQAPPSPTEPQVPPWMSPGRSVQEILAVMQPVAFEDIQPEADRITRQELDSYIAMTKSSQDPVNSAAYDVLGDEFRKRMESSPRREQKKKSSPQGSKSIPKSSVVSNIADSLDVGFNRVASVAWAILNRATHGNPLSASRTAMEQAINSAIRIANKHLRGVYQGVDNLMRVLERHTALQEDDSPSTMPKPDAPETEAVANHARQRILAHIRDIEDAIAEVQAWESAPVGIDVTDRTRGQVRRWHDIAIQLNALRGADSVLRRSWLQGYSKRGAQPGDVAAAKHLKQLSRWATSHLTDVDRWLDSIKQHPDRVRQVVALDASYGMPRGAMSWTKFRQALADAQGEQSERANRLKQSIEELNAHYEQQAQSRAVLQEELDMLQRLHSRIRVNMWQRGVHIPGWQLTPSELEVARLYNYIAVLEAEQRAGVAQPGKQPESIVEHIDSIIGKTSEPGKEPDPLLYAVRDIVANSGAIGVIQSQVLRDSIERIDGIISRRKEGVEKQQRVKEGDKVRPLESYSDEELTRMRNALLAALQHVNAAGLAQVRRQGATRVYTFTDVSPENADIGFSDFVDYLSTEDRAAIDRQAYNPLEHIVTNAEPFGLTREDIYNLFTTTANPFQAFEAAERRSLENTAKEIISEAEALEPIVLPAPKRQLVQEAINILEDARSKGMDTGMLTLVLSGILQEEDSIRGLRALNLLKWGIAEPAPAALDRAHQRLTAYILSRAYAARNLALPRYHEVNPEIINAVAREAKDLIVQAIPGLNRRLLFSYEVNARRFADRIGEFLDKVAPAGDPENLLAQAQNDLRDETLGKFHMSRELRQQLVQAIKTTADRVEQQAREGSLRVESRFVPELPDNPTGIELANWAKAINSFLLNSPTSLFSSGLKAKPELVGWLLEQIPPEDQWMIPVAKMLGIQVQLDARNAAFSIFHSINGKVIIRVSKSLARSQDERAGRTFSNWLWTAIAQAVVGYKQAVRGEVPDFINVSQFSQLKETMRRLVTFISSDSENRPFDPVLGYSLLAAATKRYITYAQAEVLIARLEKLGYRLPIAANNIQMWLEHRRAAEPDANENTPLSYDSLCQVLQAIAAATPGVEPVYDSNTGTWDYAWSIPRRIAAALEKQWQEGRLPPDQLILAADGARQLMLAHDVVLPQLDAAIFSATEALRQVKELKGSKKNTAQQALDASCQLIFHAMRQSTCVPDAIESVLCSEGEEAEILATILDYSTRLCLVLDHAYIRQGFPQVVNDYVLHPVRKLESTLRQVVAKLSGPRSTPPDIANFLTSIKDDVAKIVRTARELLEQCGAIRQQPQTQDTPPWLSAVANAISDARSIAEEMVNRLRGLSDQEGAQKYADDIEKYLNAMANVVPAMLERRWRESPTNETAARIMADVREHYTKLEALIKQAGRLTGQEEHARYAKLGDIILRDDPGSIDYDVQVRPRLEAIQSTANSLLGSLLNAVATACEIPSLDESTRSSLQRLVDDYRRRANIAFGDSKYAAFLRSGDYARDPRSIQEVNRLLPSDSSVLPIDVMHMIANMVSRWTSSAQLDLTPEEVVAAMVDYLERTKVGRVLQAPSALRKTLLQVLSGVGVTREEYVRLVLSAQSRRANLGLIGSVADTLQSYIRDAAEHVHASILPFEPIDSGSDIFRGVIESPEQPSPQEVVAAEEPQAERPEEERAPAGEEPPQPPEEPISGEEEPSGEEEQAPAAEEPPGGGGEEPPGGGGEQPNEFSPQPGIGLLIKAVEWLERFNRQPSQGLGLTIRPSTKRWRATLRQFRNKASAAGQQIQQTAVRLYRQYLQNLSKDEQDIVTAIVEHLMSANNVDSAYALNALIRWMPDVVSSLGGLTEDETSLLESFRTFYEEVIRGGNTEEAARKVLEGILLGSEQSGRVAAYESLRRKLYDYLMGGDITGLAEEQRRVVQAARAMRRFDSTVGSVFVSLGLLSPEAYSSWVDHHFRRFYSAFLLSWEFLHVVRRAQLPEGLPARLEGFLHMWNGDPDSLIQFTTGLYERENVPPHIRQLLGEITNPGLKLLEFARIADNIVCRHLIFSMVANHFRNYRDDGTGIEIPATSRLAEPVANILSPQQAVAEVDPEQPPEEFADRVIAAFRQAERTPVSHAPFARSILSRGKPGVLFGACEGMVLPRMVALDILAMAQAAPQLHPFLGKALAIFKMTRVAWNVPTCFRNMLSNPTLAYLEVGLKALNPAHWIAAASEIIDYDLGGEMSPDIQDCSRYIPDLVDATVRVEIAPEIQRQLSQLRQQFRIEQLSARREMASAQFQAAVALLSDLGQRAANLYMTAERIAKLATYKALRASGVEPQQAAYRAQQALFDYSDVPYVLRYARNFGIFFFPTFWYKSALQMLRHPARTAAIIGAYYAVRWLIESAFAEDDDRRRRALEQRLLDPRWTYIRIPGNRPLYIDLAPFVPHVEFISTLQMGGKEAIGRLLSGSVEAIAESPIFGGRNLYTGRLPLTKYAPPPDIRDAWVEWMMNYNPLAVPFMARLYDDIQLAKRGAPQAYGFEPMTLETAVLRDIFGVRTATYNLLQVRYRRIKQLENMVNQYRMAVRRYVSEAIVRKVPPEVFAARLEQYEKHRDKLAQKIAEEAVNLMLPLENSSFGQPGVINIMRRLADPSEIALQQLESLAKGGVSM